MLPDGWHIATLGSLASVERGRFSARPRNDPKYFGGNVPFVQTGDVANAGMYLRSYSQTLNAQGVSVSKIFPSNTILITIAANIGATALTTFPVACPDSVVAIRPHVERTDVIWLKYALTLKQSSLDDQAGQNAQKNINLRVLNPLELRTPPLLEQREIGRALLLWDETIATTERLLAKSREQKQALMQRLLLSGSASTNWRLVQIRNIADRVTRGTSGDSEKFPILMISSSSGFIRQDEQYGRYMAGKSVEHYVLLNKGEFAYNKGNSKRYEFGCVFPLENYEKGLVPHVYVCFALREECDPTFFKYLVEADYLHDQLGALVNTGVRNNGLLNIRPADFMGVTIPLPPLKDQRRIATILRTASDGVACFECDLAALKVQKQALMQQLLTGKRRLRLS